MDLPRPPHVLPDANREQVDGQPGSADAVIVRFKNVGGAAELPEDKLQVKVCPLPAWHPRGG